MRKLLAVLLVFGSASTAFGFDKNDDEVHWRGIAGVIAVQGGNNPLATRSMLTSTAVRSRGPLGAARRR